jgi:hypothetical protein
MSLIGPKIKPATEEDYIKIQGGMPKVEIENGITVITHDYKDGDKMVVRSHIDHGTTYIDGKEFKIDLLRKFHGDPCEKQSRSIGGEGYERKQ